MLAIGIGGNTPLDYNITDSLRFRRSANAYLSRTPASTGNRKTFTFSLWFKGKGYYTGNDHLIGVNTSSTSYARVYYGASGDNYLRVNQYVGGVNIDLRTTQVLRDPSAWYHLVVAFDTTQATASNRIKMYLNGEQITSFATATYPSQNFDTLFNTTNEHRIGTLGANFNVGYEFDGYMAEVNFIDGQALTPSDFGSTNADGVWSPKKYTGTYGTNGFYLNFADKTDFKSFELDGTGDYISAPASEYANYINGSGDFTIEWWVNYDALPSDGGWYAQDSGSAVVSPFNLFQQTNSWRLYATTANGAWNVFSNTLLATTSLTTNRWYHIACVRNGSTLTLYVDGVSQGTASIGTASLWTDTSHNLSLFNDWQSAGGGGGIDGTISNYRLVKGTAVYTSNFTPPTANLENISGTTILLARSTSTADLSGNITTTANGNLSLVDHLPPISSAIGDDVSGNDNHFATNNFDLTSTATTYDLMSDTPSLADEDTGNFATINPLDADTSANLSISNANLTMSASNLYWSQARATIGVSSGKWYWEVDYISATSNKYFMNGIRDVNETLVTSSDYVGESSGGYAYYSHNGYKYNNATSSAYGSTATTGDTIGVALDMDAGTLTFYKNGTSQGVAYTGLSGTFAPAFSVNGNTGGTVVQAVNFGQRPFKYTPPTGYKKLNTYNLPDSSITDGSQYFNAVTYTGDGGTSNSLSYDFSPDLVWSKSRSNAQSNVLYDSVRGGNKVILSNSTQAENTISPDAISFDSNGHTWTYGYSASNFSGYTYVNWSWRGSDSTAVSNTDGTITSTVSANPTSGFSVVTYTGNGSANQTVGHGLGQTPKIIIYKDRSAATAWRVIPAFINDGYYLALNDTSAMVTASTSYFGSNTSTTLGISGSNSGIINASGNNLVAYAFADVEGFSKFGSYTGNGSTDGPFVYTGFRPAFVMVKSTSIAQHWVMHDTSRISYNLNNLALFPSLSNAETTENTSNSPHDMLSNGFKLRGIGDASNQSGATYIYMAFAENPFKNSLAR